MDNQADKSQEATPYKLEEARKKGQIGKSVEFVSIISLIVMLTAFLIMLPTFSSSMNTNMKDWLINTNQLTKSNTLLFEYIKQFLTDVGLVITIMLSAGALSTVLFSILHAGPVFSLHPLKMDFAKLNPIQGLKKIFSRKGLFEIFKLILKFIFIAIAMVFLWAQIKHMIIYQNALSIPIILENWNTALTTTIVCFLTIFLAFSLLDLWFSKKDFSKQMRMSTRDIKDEYKKREGDPEIKHKRKKNMHQLMKSVVSVANVKHADVIITNPTHYAIALQYRSKKMPLPKVLSKGRGFIAKLIIFNAKKIGVPIVRRPGLARKIYKETTVESYIPVSEQVAVAEIYRAIINLPGSKVFS